ncbi:MAG: zinc-ribbon domain-containing protein [Candidatus Thorarchaeota archaeon]
MSGTEECPKCGKKVGKGSTFCIGCGTRIEGSHASVTVTSDDHAVLPDIDEKLDYGSIEDTDGDDVTLPDVDESELPGDPGIDIVEGSSGRYAEMAVEENEGVVDEPIARETVYAEMGEIEPPRVTDSGPEITVPEMRDVVPPTMSWDDEIEERSSDEVKEGMPFVEVEPPKVLSYDMDTMMTEEAILHVLPEADRSTTDAVAHLFPEGRGTTSPDFIDAVVGKPRKIAPTKPLRELHLADCPGCGMALTEDEDFEYPQYVYDAMGKARVEFGDKKIVENDHERAIEEYEKAKLLFERSGNVKNIDEAIKRIDEGYEKMAGYHFDQAELHLKESEFEWAIVQYKKARELYMLTTDSRMKVKCAQKVRDCFADWGRAIETEGDMYSKQGRSRDALDLYRQAAEKYRQGDATSKLKGLDKKIRKA